MSESTETAAREFRYRAVGEDGTVRHGSIEAHSEAAVLQRLRRQGLMPIHVAAGGGRRRFADLLNTEITLGSGVSAAERQSAAAELATLLGAGVATDEALDILTRSGRSGVTAQLKSVLRDVRGGAPLSTALANRKTLFPPEIVALVEAGEASGTLPQVLGSVAEAMREREELRRQVVSALIYPAFLVLAAVLAIGMLVFVVLPAMEPIIRSAGTSLPLVTRIVFDVASAGQTYWIEGLTTLLLCVLVAVLVLRRPASRMAIDRLMLSMPMLGRLLYLSTTAHFAGDLALMLRGGMTLTGALAIVARTTRSSHVRSAIGDLSRDIADGEPISSALAKRPILTPKAERMVEVGERTGRLADMLEHVSRAHRADLKSASAAFLAALVPVLTLVFGGATAFVVASVLFALLSINEAALQ